MELLRGYIWSIWYQCPFTTEANIGQCLRLWEESKAQLSQNLLHEFEEWGDLILNDQFSSVSNARLPPGPTRIQNWCSAPYFDKVSFLKELALSMSQIESQLIINDIHNKCRIFEIEDFQ